MGRRPLPGQRKDSPRSESRSRRIAHRETARAERAPRAQAVRAGGRVQPGHRTAALQIGAGRAAVDALDRRHVGVEAPVADLDVGLARQAAVGRVGADPDRLAAPAACRAAAPRARRASGPRPSRCRRPRARPTGSRRRSARAMPVAAQQHEREVDEVLADAGAGGEQVLDRRADVGRAAAGSRSGRGSARRASARVASGVLRARDRRSSSSSAASSGSSSASGAGTRRPPRA